MEKRKVLVPVDGSDFCRQIFPVIMKFLDPAANDIVFLRVGSPVEGHVGMPPRPAAIESDVKSYDTARDLEFATHPIYASQERESALAAFIAEMQPDVREMEHAGFNVAYDIRFGDRGEEIVEYVNNNPVDLVAMTTHWRTGLNRLLFGNTLQHIVPHIHVPLLMLRPESSSEQ